MIEKDGQIAPYYSPERLAKNRFLPALAPTADAVLLVAVCVLFEYPPSVIDAASGLWRSLYFYSLGASFCLATLGQVLLMVWMSKTKLGQVARPMTHTVERRAVLADGYRLATACVIGFIWLIARFGHGVAVHHVFAVLTVVYGAMALYGYAIVYRYA